MTSFNLRNTDMVPATLSFLDDQGLPAAAPEGIATWSFPDESICTVLASDDGLSATVSSVADGTATLTVALGDLTASCDIIVGAAGIAAVMNIAFGDPVSK